MSSAFVENKGNTIILSVNYSPPEYALHSLEIFRLLGNEAGSGVFVSYDRGNTWTDQISGKSKPCIYAGNTDGLVAGFHLCTVRLRDGRLLAMARTSRPDFSINGNIVKSYSGDEGKTWSYQESPFKGIGSGKRPVLMRLNEGPLLFLWMMVKPGLLESIWQTERTGTLLPPRPLII